MPGQAAGERPGQDLPLVCYTLQLLTAASPAVRGQAGKPSSRTGGAERSSQVEEVGRWFRGVRRGRADRLGPWPRGPNEAFRLSLSLGEFVEKREQGCPSIELLGKE